MPLPEGTGMMYGAVGSIAFLLLVLYGLAGGGEGAAVTEEALSEDFFAPEMLRFQESVISAAFPMSLPDQLATLLSEALSGVISSSVLYFSAVASLVISRSSLAADVRRDAEALLRTISGRQEEEAPPPAKPKPWELVFGRKPTDTTTDTTTATAAVSQAQRDTAASDAIEALAAADFFVAQRALKSVLGPGIGLGGVGGGGFGLPFAGILAVLLAQLPYQAVKQLKRQQMGARGGTADELDRITRPRAGNKESGLASRFSNVSIIDFVGDVIKWLEYDVLSDTFAMYGVPTPAEAAIFGAIAALSAQVYRDSAVYFGLGSESDGEALRNRKQLSWIGQYVKTMLTASALFGVYESARLPMTELLIYIFSETSNVRQCVGSSDFYACIGAFEAFSLPSELMRKLLE